jgi:thiosulfate/3-mercaptopyruvate sulfurtransferase
LLTSDKRPGILSRVDKSTMRHILIVAVAAASLAVVQRESPASLLVQASELASLLHDPTVVVLHVADRPSAFESGHIPGARFVSYGDIAVDGSNGVGSELPPVGQLERVFEAAGVSDTSRVILYGSSTVVAARAFFTLDVLGHRRVQLLDGGLRAWQAGNLPVETGAAQPPRLGVFSPRLNKPKVVDAAFVQAHTGSAPPTQIALVDVRPDPEYLGTDGGMGGRHAAGHIRGARQLPWDSLVGADGRFLARGELDAKLRAAGASPDKPVVAYCMVGMRASVVYFVARHLGYEPRLYDGSIVDWSHRSLPVVKGREF